MCSAHIIELFPVAGKCQLCTDFGKVVFGFGFGKAFKDGVDIGRFRFGFFDLRGQHHAGRLGFIVLLIVALGILRRRIAAVELNFDGRASLRQNN